MIRRVTLRKFKRFEETTFTIPGNVVVAGPNNTGKTTLLQAIAAWSLVLNRWRELNNYHRRGGVYERAPIARHAFASVPLRQFDLLWRDRQYDRHGPIEIELSTDEWSIRMELIPDSTEQIYVRPIGAAEPEVVRAAMISPVFVPAMSGLSIAEPVYQSAKVDEFLALAKPGDVLRNLLLEAHGRGEVWQELSTSIRRLFRFELLPPDGRGANILAEYSAGPTATRFDIASAGSGFQQVLMLFAFLYSRPSSVFLLDEPDAHLHVILQDAIYGELREVAARQHSQLIVATHSEVIINAVDPSELCALIGQPRILAETAERRSLIQALGALSNEDIMLALEVPGVLYLEDYTDLLILRAWAEVLDHPALEILTTRLFWKKVVSRPRPGAEGIPTRQHYDALGMVGSDLPGLEIIDGDGRPEIPPTPITGRGLQRARWKRYEIESYLLHPVALGRFVERVVGSLQAAPHVEALQQHFRDNYPPRFIDDPLSDYAMLVGTKARTLLLPPALSAAGLPGFDYTRYHEIAAVMEPEEIHPDVREMLDTMMRAFGQ